LGRGLRGCGSGFRCGGIVEGGGDFPKLDKFGSKLFNGQALILGQGDVKLLREDRNDTAKIGARVVFVNSINRIGAKLTPMGEQVVIEVRPQGLAGLPHLPW